MLRSSSRIGAATLLVASLLGISQSALASPEFPADIEGYWRIKSLPVTGQGCTLCHSSDLGETGTVVQPFGKMMRAQGLMPEDPNSLHAALGYVTAHSVTKPIVDSDGDGVPDFNEIVYDHTNPNDPRSFVAPVKMPPPSNGGAGGDTGTTGEGGASTGETPEPPTFEAPSAADLPPTFVHGCALAPATTGDAASVAGLFTVFALVQRRARRRARVRR